MNLCDCKRVLLFGGSFDPPHTAHIALPRMAMKAINADALAYIPAAQSPFKLDREPTPAHHRLEMLRVALSTEPKDATILTIELDRAAKNPGAPSYTVDTLTHLHQELGPRVEMRLLIGADQLRSFDRWKDYQRIIALAEPVVMVRPPDTRESLLSALPKGFDRVEWAARLVDLPLIDVSATEIRQRIAEGKPISGMVPPAVERYIREHGLYRSRID